jgi:transcriptional regulator with XRE-family HTH domain
MTMDLVISTYLDAAELGARIVGLRTERGVSQRRLAEELDIDGSALSRVESGHRGLAVGELVALAAFLGVSTDALVRSEAPAQPLFRHDGDESAAAIAVAEFEAVIDDFLALEATLRR